MRAARALRLTVPVVVASAIMLLVGMRLAPGREEAPKGFARWEKAIAEFEASDRENPPPKGGILFTGSSSIVRWDLKKSFPGVEAINRGFGGSQIADSTHFAARLVLKHEPRTIVFYAGDNDLAAGKTPGQVTTDFRSFVETVHTALPKTRIAFLAIKPSPSRWRFVGEQRKANALIEEYCKADKRLVYIDTFQPMLGDDGKPRPELFRDDELHLSASGYALWNSLVAPILK